MDSLDPLLLADLSATCNNLGYFNETTGQYMLEPDCVECVKELIRFLRRDDECHGVRRALGDTNVLVKDLIPIVKLHAQNTELFEVTLRLLVNLTTPVQVLYEEEVPAERHARHCYLQLLQCLQTYKQAFADKTFWTSVAQRLTASLGKEWEDRMEDDKLTIERILILLRNVLHVPADPAREKRTDDDASVHDQVLWALHLASVDDMLLFISQADEERQLCLHVLEVVSLMLREQSGKQLAQSGVAHNRQQRDQESRQLNELRHREQHARQASQRKMSVRHSRFGGTYCVQNLASISDRDAIYHKPLAKINDINFDKNKAGRKTPRNRQPLADETHTRRSLLSIRLALKQLCVELLAGVYNRLMYNVKDHLSRVKGQTHDESYYMWSVKFFMEFNRYHKFRVAYVSETLSVSMFHYLQTQMENYLENMMLEKNKLKVWSKRLHLALRAYQELLFTVQHMQGSGDAALDQSAHVLLSNVFYMPEYRELVLFLLGKYDPVKMSRQFLVDLVETTHVFVKLLEKFSSGSRVLVRRKRAVKRSHTRRRPTVKKVDSHSAGDSKLLTQAESAEMWPTISGQLSQLLMTPGDSVLSDVLPFDAASDTPMEQQKREAVYRIQEYLHSGRSQHAVALLRAAREVWPEGESFGAVDVSPEDELATLQTIHHASFPERANSKSSTANINNEGNEDNNDNARSVSPDEVERPEQEIGDEQDDDVVQDEEEMEEVDVNDGDDHEFDFQQYIRRFYSPKVVEPYCRLLRQFDTNAQETNHCILKMLHRVAWTHKLPALLFQASVFRTFHKLMDNDVFYRDPRFKDLAALAKYVLRKFFDTAKSNQLAYVEMLFWKSERDAYELQHGYDSYKEQSRAARLTWSEEEEQELLRLHDELKSTANDKPDEDLVDRIVANLISGDRSRRAVIKKLRQLGVMTGRSSCGRRAGGGRVEWSQPLLDELHALWTDCRSATDPVSLICQRLSTRCSKSQVRQQLLQAGLAANRAELRKKRTKKSAAVKHNRFDSDSGDEIRRGSDGSDADSSDSDDTDTPLESAEIAAHSEDTSRPSGNVPPTSRASVTEQQLCAILANYSKCDESEGELLRWLSESVDDTLDCRSAEGGATGRDSVALVPVTAACCLALETPAAIEMIKALGALPPDNSEGEMFWRWPADIASQVLARNKRLLSQCLDGTLAVSDRGEGSLNGDAVQQNAHNSTDFNSRLSRSAMSTLSDSDEAEVMLASLEQQLHQNDDDEDAENRSARVSAVSQSSTKSASGMSTKRVQQTDSGGESDAGDVEEKTSSLVKRSRIMRRALVSDDDDDGHMARGTGPEDQGDATSPPRSGLNETAGRRRIRQAILSSDSE